MLCDLLDEAISSDDDPDDPAPMEQPEKVESSVIESNAANGAEVEEENELDDDGDIEKQLKMMQEQMAMMQKKLEEKKRMKESKEKANRSISEVDLFSAEPSTSGPKSPVKTNPFEDANKDRKSIKLHEKTPAFGPALSSKSTRILQGEGINAYNCWIVHFMLFWSF